MPKFAIAYRLWLRYKTSGAEFKALAVELGYEHHSDLSAACWREHARRSGWLRAA